MELFNTVLFPELLPVLFPVFIPEMLPELSPELFPPRLFPSLGNSARLSVEGGMPFSLEEEEGTLVMVSAEDLEAVHLLLLLGTCD